MSRRKGVAIIIAVFMAAELAVVAAAIHAITIKEQEVTTLAEDSVRAFVAAESLAECFRFYDTRVGNFGTATPIAMRCGASWTPITAYVPTAGEIADGSSRTYDPPSSEEAGYLGYPYGPCANALMVKTVDASGRVFTELYASGINYCSPSGRRRLERGIIIRY